VPIFNAGSIGFVFNANVIQTTLVEKSNLFSMTEKSIEDK
jgi:hypothetical protein